MLARCTTNEMYFFLPETQQLTAEKVPVLTRVYVRQCHEILYGQLYLIHILVLFTLM